MKISINNHATSTHEVVELPDGVRDIEGELSQLGFPINDITYMVLGREKTAFTQIHNYEIDDYLLIVNGEIWAVSGNDEFYDVEEVAPPPIPDGAQVMCVRVMPYHKEYI